MSNPCAVPLNPLVVIGKQTELTFMVVAGTATMTPSNTSCRIYKLRLAGGLRIIASSDRPNRVIEGNVPPHAFAVLWRPSLPNEFTKDPPDAYVAYCSETRKVQCVLPYGGNARGAGGGCGKGGCGGCVKGGGGGGGCCAPCAPCVLQGLVGAAQVNPDGSMDLYLQLTQDVREFPVETVLGGFSMTLRSVFVPPRGTYRLKIAVTRACPVFSDAFAGCNPNSDSAVSTSFNVLFADDGNTMDFSDPIDGSSGLGRFTMMVSWPRKGRVALHTRGGAVVNAVSQERYDETGQNKYRVVWVWTFNSSEVDPAPPLPQYAYVARWTLTSTSTLPTAS